MRRRRTFLILLLALASGALAGYSALQIINNPNVPIDPQPSDDTQFIVVAAQPIAVGTPLSAELVRLTPWPRELALPEGALREVAEAVGRGAARDFVIGEPILESRLGTRGGDYGLAIQIPEDMRAVTIRVADVTVVDGWFQPGMRADVILTMDPVTGGNTKSQIAMQNLRLLAAGPVVTKDPQGNQIRYGAATFLVSPEDAERLVLMESKGSIQLAMRNSIDTKEISTTGLRTENLYPSSGGGTRAVASGTRSAPPPVPVDRSIGVWINGVKTIIRY